MLELMKLPFEEDALEPYISEKTVRLHYEKHHKGYVDMVNRLIAGTEFQNMHVEEIIELTYNKSDLQVLYDNAGQVFNHNVYWKSMGIGNEMKDDVKTKIKEAFGDMEILKEELVDKATTFFGSGWVWLAEGKGGKLEVLTTKNGDTPLVLGYKPIFNIDVWEHAYYLDYKNLKKDYAEAFVSHLLEVFA